MFYVPDPTHRSDFLFCVFGAFFYSFVYFLHRFSATVPIPLLQKEGVNHGGFESRAGTYSDTIISLPHALTLNTRVHESQIRSLGIHC